MLVAFPVYKDDCKPLLNLLQWIFQLGGCTNHDAVIVADAATPASQVFQLKEKAKRSFANVEIITTDRPVNGWPHGPNVLFLRSAKHAKEKNRAWLFCEPDCVPLATGWLDKIEIHYRAKGSKYLGRIVPCSKPGLPVRHFTGVGVYPPEAYDDLHQLILASPEKAFDLSTAEHLAAVATNSELFQHLWGEVGRPPRFESKRIPGTEVFDTGLLNPQAVLFHRNKDGSLIQLLRIKSGLKQKTFIQLGRIGDIILLMPAMKWLYENDGLKPRLIVSDENASVLEGVSYVEPVSLHVHWWYGMAEARKYADKHFGGATVIQCHADKWTCDVNQWPNFMQSTHSRTGVPMELLRKLPMVFDQRNHYREREHIPKTGGRPYILVNTIGFSSPFPHRQHLLDSLAKFNSQVVVIDMATLKLPRIYDLLGLYDHAIGSIHIDTATLHLAAGSPTPYIGFTRGGWASAIPRGNCVLAMEYADYPRRSNEVTQTVESWIHQTTQR